MDYQESTFEVPAKSTNAFILPAGFQTGIADTIKVTQQQNALKATERDTTPTRRNASNEGPRQFPSVMKNWDYFLTASKPVYFDLKKIYMLDNNSMDEDTFDYLLVRNPRVGRFYLLPKIHKPSIPDRPICSSNNRRTENISCFLDHHIHKYMSELLSYVIDTQHFIKEIKALGRIPKGSIIATLVPPG